MLPILLLIIIIGMSMLYCRSISSMVSPMLISYDFDNTLKNQYNSEHIKPIVDKMISDHKKGIKVIICTSRFKVHTDEIKGFLKRYNVGNIPIYATNHGPKSKVMNSFINQGYSVIHYDDQIPVMKEILDNTNNKMTCIQVLYEDYTPNKDYKDITRVYSNYLDS